jgi:hypothetical protein
MIFSNSSESVSGYLVFSMTFSVLLLLSFLCYFSQVTAKAVSGSLFGRGNGRVWLSDVQCTGSEADISNCSMSWSSGVNCDHTNDAGVICDCKETPIKFTILVLG